MFLGFHWNPLVSVLVVEHSHVAGDLAPSRPEFPTLVAPASILRRRSTVVTLVTLGSWRLAHQYITFNMLEVFGDDVVQCPPLPNQNFGFFWSQETKRLALRLLKVAEKHLNRHKERQEQLATWHKKRWLVFLRGSSNKTKGHLKKKNCYHFALFSFFPSFTVVFQALKLREYNWDERMAFWQWILNDFEVSASVLSVSCFL